MPTYSYKCPTCGNAFDIVQSFTDEALTVCGVCGAALRKVFSPIGVSFNGSGFYRTDSRPAPKGEGSGSGDSGSTSDSGSKADSGSKSESGSKSDPGSKSNSSGSGTKSDSGSSASSGSTSSTPAAKPATTSGASSS